MGLNTTPRTWVASEVVTVAELNTEVRDALTGIQAGWTTYTPTLTNITIGNGSANGGYLQIGKTIFARFIFIAGSTTTYAAGALGVSLPVAANALYIGGASNNYAVGSGIAQPGATKVSVTPFVTSTGIINYLLDSSTTAAIITNTVPAAFGTGSFISHTITYQAA
jgi:hypothetical protein